MNISRPKLAGFQNESANWISHCCCYSCYSFVGYLMRGEDAPTARDSSVRDALLASMGTPHADAGGWVKNTTAIASDAAGFVLKEFRFDSIDDAISHGHQGPFIVRLGSPENSHFVVLESKDQCLWDPWTNSASLVNKSITSVRVLVPVDGEVIF